MFDASVAAVDDGDGGELGGDCGAGGIRVAEDDCVAVLAECADGVLECFALLGGGVGGIDRYCSTAETLHGCIEGGGCAR